MAPKNHPHPEEAALRDAAEAAPQDKLRPFSTGVQHDPASFETRLPALLRMR